MKQGIRENAALRKRIETQSAQLKVEALVPHASDVRQTQAQWDAGAKTNMTSYADGRLALTPTSTNMIAQTAGTTNITDLDDVLPIDMVGIEFGASLFGENPKLRRLDLFLDIQPNTGLPPFDGEFFLEVCRIAKDEWAQGVVEILSLQPVVRSLRLKASEFTALSGLVSFTFADSPFANRAHGPTMDRTWVPPKPVGDHSAVGFLESTNRMAIIILTAVPAASGNTNYAWKKDTGVANPFTSGSMGLRYFGLNLLSFINQNGHYRGNPVAGTGCPRMTVYCDAYPATGSWLKTGFDLGAAPVGTLEFRLTDNVPAGCTGVASVRVPAGPGPWIPFRDGQTPADIGIASQQTYDFKYEVTSDATQTASPELWAIGVLDRTNLDLSEIATLSDFEEKVEPLTGQVRMAEAQLELAMTGLRDYKDVVTSFLTAWHPTQLQVRTMLGGPGLVRTDYGSLDLWDVDDVEVGEASIKLTLISILNRLGGRFPRAGGTRVGYRLKSVVSDLTGGADFTRELSLDAETPGSITFSVAASVTEVQYGITTLKTPGLIRWPTGRWSVKVDITAGNSNLFLGVRLVRTLENGTLMERRPDRATIAAAEEQQCTTGVKTFVLDPVAWIEGTTAGTDRLRVEYYFRNAAGSPQSVTIATGGVNSEVLPPWIEATSVAPQAFSAVYAGLAFATWRDTVVGLPARFRGAVPDTYEHRISKQVMDADGKRELERIAYTDGCTVIGSQGVIKAVNLWGNRGIVASAFALEQAESRASRGFSDRLPEFVVPYGYDTVKPRAFAGEVDAQNVLAYNAFGPARLKQDLPRLEDEIARYIIDQELAGEIARGIVVSMGSGFLTIEVTPSIWCPELEIGDDVAIETDGFALKNPISGAGIAGFAWAVGTIIGVRGWQRKSFTVWVRGLADLWVTADTMQRRIPYEGPVVVAAVNPSPGEPGNATVVARCSSTTATIYYYVHDDATDPPSRERLELWRIYTTQLDVPRDASLFKLVSFFARDGGFTGPLVTYRIPPDARASIGTLTPTEAGASPNIQVTWNAGQLDADCRRIRWYIRKHATNYPTLDGTTTGVLDETYFVAETAVLADAGGKLSQLHTGTNYATGEKSKVIAVPLDYNGNPGIRKTGDYTTVNAASRAPGSFVWANNVTTVGLERTYDFTWTAGTMLAGDDLFIRQSSQYGDEGVVASETGNPTTTLTKTNVPSGHYTSNGKFDPFTTLTFFWELKDSGGNLINSGTISPAYGDAFHEIP